MDTLQNLTTSVSQLGGRVDQAVTQISTSACPVDPQASSAPTAPAAAPSISPPSLSRKPYILTPPRYSGELGTCTQFFAPVDEPYHFFHHTLQPDLAARYAQVSSELFTIGGSS